MTGQPHYPYRDGERAVLGPEVFASADGMTITWQGARYRRETEALADRLDRIRRQMASAAADRPTPEQLAEWDAVDKEMARRIHAARPGMPLHQVFAVLQTLRSVQRLDETAAVPMEAALDRPPAHDGGPTVREAAANDRRWPLEKTGE